LPGSQDRVSGNWITAERFKHGLELLGHQVALHETTLQPHGRLQRRLRDFAPDVALLLHAYRSGKPWQEEASGLGIPCVVLLTGTDVNVGLSDPVQAPVIAAVLDRAAAILAQDTAIVATLRASWPALAPRVHVLPPGISLGSDPYPVREQLSLAGDEVLLLCPAGIRPVKGVLELLELCEPLAGEGYRFRLLFCGPVLDAGYGERFRAALASRPWASYLGVVPPAAMPALLQQVDLVVSNSRSEGLPNALVEAATLGRPILASAISGNAAVVSPGHNGLLFRNRNDFVAALRSLLDDPARLRALSRPDPGRFAPERESAVLERLCQDILTVQCGAAEPTDVSA